MFGVQVPRLPARRGAGPGLGAGPGARGAGGVSALGPAGSVGARRRAERRRGRAGHQRQQRPQPHRSERTMINTQDRCAVRSPSSLAPRRGGGSGSGGGWARAGAEAAGRPRDVGRPLRLSPVKIPIEASFPSGGTPRGWAWVRQGLSTPR